MVIRLSSKTPLRRYLLANIPSVLVLVWVVFDGEEQLVQVLDPLEPEICGVKGALDDSPPVLVLFYKASAVLSRSISNNSKLTPTDRLTVTIVVASAAVAASHYGALVETIPVKVVLAEALNVECRAAAGAA